MYLEKSLRQSIKIKESLATLKKLKKKQTSYKSIQKIELLGLLKSTPDILYEVSAKEIDISLRTQERWISNYLDKGIDKFIKPKLILSNQRKSHLKFMTD